MHIEQGGASLALQGLVVGYSGKKLSGPLLATFKSGHLYGIVGPNGAGKSTLLRACIGLGGKLAGGTAISIDGRSYSSLISRWRGVVSLMPQRRSCFLDLSVRENVSVISRQSWSHAIGSLRVHWGSAAISVSDWRNRKMRTLSGGERQLVALSSYLVSRSRIILFDEPAEGLDNNLRAAAYEVIRTNAKRSDRLVLAVDHNYRLLAKYSDSVLKLGEEGLLPDTGGAG